MKAQIQEPCRSCESKNCCQSGQVFHFDKTKQGRADARKVIALNPHNYKGVVISEDPRYHLQLLEDCQALLPNTTCRVHDDPEQYPEACRNREADGFCQLTGTISLS